MYISRIGEVRIFRHREIEGKVKNLIIKRDIDRWFAIFVCEIKGKITDTSKKVVDKIVDIAKKTGKKTGS